MFTSSIRRSILAAGIAFGFIPIATHAGASGPTFMSPSQITDINTVPQDHVIYELTVINGTVYFAVDDAVHGTELWKSDGTDAGTMMVKDINLGESGSSPSNFIEMNGAIYFSASDGNAGTELWTTDGTEAGTRLVKDISSGIDSSNPDKFAVLNGTLYFAADDGTNGTELWKSDGTDAGTVLVRDIYIGSQSGSPNSSAPDALTVFNNAVYFRADNGTNGQELWKSDGTELGTTMVADIYSGSDGSRIRMLTVFNGSLYFGAEDSVNGRELRKTDGTTVETLSIRSGASDGFSGNENPVNMLVVGNALYFAGNNGTNGTELWKTDGTTHTMVTDIRTGSNSSSPEGFTNADGKLYFRANDGTNGQELWKSDGTPGGTTMVKDIRIGSSDSSISSLTAVGASVYFNADDGSNGSELWMTDGTEPGTTMVKDINPGSAGSSPRELTVSGTTLYFIAVDNGTEGGELWRSNGTPGGTTMIKDINPRTFGSYPGSYVPLNDGFVFVADSTLDGLRSNAELWKTDGTAAGTQVVKELCPSTFESGMRSVPDADSDRAHRVIEKVGTRVFVKANDCQGSFVLWVSDGTTAGTTQITPSTGPQSFSSLSSMTAFGSSLLFFADDGTNGLELWISDGTNTGTRMVKDIWSGGSSIDPWVGDLRLTHVINETMYFIADDGIHGFELWRTDGTPGGTTMVKDISQGTDQSFSAISSPSFASIGNTLYFNARENNTDATLWKTDGTAGGTVEVVPASPADEFTRVNFITTVGSRVYFGAQGVSNGYELWTSDGTAGGTRLVKDINLTGDGINRNGGNPSFPFYAHGSTLYFSANDGTSGTELWTSDGTESGTTMVNDLAPGSTSSRPVRLTSFGSALFFMAEDSATETYELMRLDGTTMTLVTTGTEVAKPNYRIAVNDSKVIFTGETLKGLEPWILAMAAETPQQPAESDTTTSTPSVAVTTTTTIPAAASPGVTTPPAATPANNITTTTFTRSSSPVRARALPATGNYGGSLPNAALAVVLLGLALVVGGRLSRRMPH